MKSKPTFQCWQVFSLWLVFTLLVSSTGYSPVKAQSSLQFEGIIAYKDPTGNIILATGDGRKIPVTTDADANQNPLQRNQKPTYEIFGFSPNGAYLAFHRWSDDEGDRLYIYKIANSSISAKLNFSEYSLYNPIQWHKDSDSIIAHQSVEEETGIENLAYDHEFYYRVSFSGERVLLFDTYSNPHRMNINFDLDTYFENNDKYGVILHNWIENTKYEIPDVATITAAGVWTHDGSHFIHVDNEYGTISIVDLKTGTLVEQLQMPDEMWALDGSLQQLHKHVYPPYHYFLLSLDSKHLLLTDENAGLYDLDLETSAVESVYTWPVHHSGNEIKALWSSSGNLVMVNTYSSNEQGVLVVKKGNLPVRVATNAEPLFWLSKDSERLVYAQYKVSGNQIDGDLMVYDHATGASTKVGDLPTIKDVVVLSEISYGHYQHSVDWTNGEETLPLVPSNDNVTPPPVAVPCPFELIFQEKEGVINSLQNPPQISELETGVALPFDFLEPSKWRYEEEAAQNLVDSMRKECGSYSNGTMTLEEKARFEAKVMAFKRLTYTEIALNGLFPQYLNTVYETSGPLSDLLFSAFSVFSSMIGVQDWLSKQDSPLAGVAKETLTKATNFYLDFIDYVLDAQVGKLGKMAKTTFHPLIQMIQTAVDPIKGLKDIGKESVAQKLLTSFFIDNYVASTQYEINIAVANVPLENDPKYPYLSMTGTDREAEDAIDDLLQESTQETEKTLETMRILGSEASGVDLLGDALEISSKVTLLASPATGPAAPAAVSLAGFLESLSKIMEASVFSMRIISTGMGASHGGTLISYATNSADIAFDPSQLKAVLAQENQIINLDVASLNFVPSNYVPASMYYSRYQEQTNAATDEYKASIEQLMQAIASGQDEQIRTAAEELLKIDDELRMMLKTVEAPLTEMSYDRPEVQNLVFSVQDLRAQSVTLHVTLAMYMVQKTSPEIQQETQTIAANVLTSADNFNAIYETMTQSGLAIPVKFLPVILDAKTPDAIVEGDNFSMMVKISNVGQISQQSPVTLSVAGGDKVEVSANQPLPELAPNSLIEIPVSLKAKQDGNEFITIELMQDGSVIASKIIFLEIGKSNSIFGLPPTSYVIGGGLGLLCLTVLAIGGVFVYTRTRKPKRVSKKPVGRQQPSKPAPGSAEQIKRAIELSKAKRYQEAFEILREIVQTEPNNMSAWFNLGGVLASMGNYKDAEYCYTRAKQLGHPRGEDALRWLRELRN